MKFLLGRFYITYYCHCYFYLFVLYLYSLFVVIITVYDELK